MSGASLAVVERSAALAYEPAGIAECLDLAKLLVASGLLPKSIRTPEAAIVIMITGRELGLTTMQSLRAIYIVDGKASLSADLIAALVKRSSACEWFRLVESSSTIATYETKRRGEPSPTRMSFTSDEARVAGLLSKDSWRHYPAAMLRARAAAALARAVYPDVAMGMYDPDELNAAPVESPNLSAVVASVVAHSASATADADANREASYVESLRAEAADLATKAPDDKRDGITQWLEAVGTNADELERGIERLKKLSQEAT